MTNSISLFSGAMGLDLGLEAAGFVTSACVENDSSAVETIKLNRPDQPVFDCSISEVAGNQIRRAAGIGRRRLSLLAGGPPCQSFSVFGNRLGIQDARGQLIFEFVRLVDELQPACFLMENVRGLLSMALLSSKVSADQNDTYPASYYEKGSLLSKIMSELNDIGYNVDCFVVNSVNYGAPQIRERVFLIGNRFGYSASFPQPEFSNRSEDNLPPFKTLGDVIGPNSGFKDNEREIMDFSPRKLKYLAMVPPGGNWRSLPEEIQKESMKKSWYLKGGRSAYWRKLSFDFPSPTVVTMPNHAGTSMCHPTELRAISVAEAAAIQEFPPHWQFAGKTAAKFKQIGNAVPVRLGQVAGKSLMQILKKIEEQGKSKQGQCESSITHIRPHIRTRTFWKNGRPYAGSTDYYDRNPAETSSQAELDLS